MVDRSCRGRGVDWDRELVRRVPIPIERARLKSNESPSNVDDIETCIYRIRRQWSDCRISDAGDEKVKEGSSRSEFRPGDN